MLTEKPEGSLFSQTTTRYRCSNDACQSEKDKQEAKRKQQVLDKEARVKEATLRKGWKVTPKLTV
jgi:hypothetical protein